MWATMIFPPFTAISASALVCHRQKSVLYMNKDNLRGNLLQKAPPLSFLFFLCKPLQRDNNKLVAVEKAWDPRVVTHTAADDEAIVV